MDSSTSKLKSKAENIIISFTPKVESQALSGNGGLMPLEVAGYLPVIINGIKYKIPLFYD